MKATIELTEEMLKLALNGDGLSIQVNGVGAEFVLDDGEEEAVESVDTLDPDGWYYVDTSAYDEDELLELWNTLSDEKMDSLFRWKYLAFKDDRWNRWDDFEDTQDCKQITPEQALQLKES